MRPIIHRLPILRPRRVSTRFFTRLPLSRPQLPFLSPTRRHTRFLTTETKQWIKGEMWRASKWTATLWTFIFLISVMVFGLQQEYAERKYPSPHEWSFLSRVNFRSVKLDESLDDIAETKDRVNWPSLSTFLTRLLHRLEDPKIDGVGLKEQDDGGILVEGLGKMGFDITGKSEPWRRGYYQVLMSLGKTAERLDGWVRDKTRNIAFPAELVIGPSNPKPRPLPPGSKPAPREEDCEMAFEPPEKFYLRILTTHGFTAKQKLDAAVAYATFLDYKGASNTALEMYNWGLDIALGTTSAPDSLLDRQTVTLRPNSGPVPDNVLQAATAIAVHHAKTSNVSTALPIFLSILRARRELKDDTASAQLSLTDDVNVSPRGRFSNFFSVLRMILAPPVYPDSPPDGTSPPVRDAKERCEEAALMTYIGEILYASNAAKSSREDGLAWTREAVDIAEEQLQKQKSSPEAMKVCRECLNAGLSNWTTMVAQLTEEEKNKKSNASSTKIGGWLGFGADEEHTVLGRWESEERVVQERTRRARDLLDVPPAQKGLGSFFV